MPEANGLLPKYFLIELKRLEYPLLMVLKEKHEDNYYMVQNEEEFFAASLEILEQRIDPEWGFISDPGEKPCGYKGLTDEKIKDMIEPYKSMALKDLRRDRALLSDHKEDVRQYAEAVRAVKEKDGPAAALILRDRNDGEYEHIEYINPTVPGKQSER